MNTPVADMLTRVAQASKSRFCMPGHKGKGGFLPIEVSRLDITELPDADNLYAPQGVIREAQELHAKHIGARESYFLVNGSSCGVHAAVLSVLEPEDKVIGGGSACICMPGDGGGRCAGRCNGKGNCAGGGKSSPRKGSLPDLSKLLWPVCRYQ